MRILIKIVLMQVNDKVLKTSNLASTAIKQTHFDRHATPMAVEPVIDDEGALESGRGAGKEKESHVNIRKLAKAGGYPA